MNELIITTPEELDKRIQESFAKAVAAITPSKATESQEVFTNKQAMKYLSVSRSTLQRWRNEGKLPYRQIENGKILYKKSDIDQFLETVAR